MNFKVGEYQIFNGSFGIRLFNWNKSKSYMRYLLWWELVVGWLHIRKFKSTKELHKEQIERDSLKVKKRNV